MRNAGGNASGVKGCVSGCAATGSGDSARGGQSAASGAGPAAGLSSGLGAGLTAEETAGLSSGLGAGLTAEETAGLSSGLGAGLTAVRIYAYLDGEMESADARALEVHLAGCPACSAAVEQRRRIGEAAESLPPFEVPDGFAEAVMARVKGPRRQARARRARRTWWAWATAAFAGLALTGGTAWILISGRSLSDVAVNASRFLWSSVQGLATLAAKSWSYATLAVKVLGKLAEQVFEGFKVLSSFIGPEVQIACLGAALVLAAGGFALWRRNIMVEKNHDES